MLAAQNGDVATVERLLKAGAKVDGDAFVDDHEIPMLTTPLLMAAAAGHAVVIAVLVKAGAKINRTTTGGLYDTSVRSRAGGAHGRCIDTRWSRRRD
jgi:ankyrin repeat protein